MNNNFVKDYNQTISFLYEQLPMFQRVGQLAYKNSLENTLALDKYFGSPHRKFKTIHIAGTNGKGSVSHLIASVLQEAGYKTGLYTSPHLKDFRERIKINGEIISEDEVVNFVNNHIGIINEISPSFFEVTVAMAFDYFVKNKVDYVVVEVGLGGRLDSTNIINPEISVITNIGIDHTAILGKTISEIAKEKGGIIKSGTPVVVGKRADESDKVLEEIAKLKNSDLYYSQEYYQVEMGDVKNNKRNLYIKNDREQFELKLPLLGLYQENNIKTVLKVFDVLNSKTKIVEDIHIYSGVESVIKNTNLLGRWQILSENPRIVADTGHNEDAIKYLVEQLATEKFENLRIVFGMVEDKDVSTVLSLMPKNAKYYFTQANLPRSLSSEKLKEKASTYGLFGENYDSVENALEKAKKDSSSNDLIFIGGSTFVVSEVI